MKKQLNENTIISELTGHSVFFREANIHTAEHKEVRTPDRLNERNAARPKASSPERLNERVTNRPSERTQDRTVDDVMRRTGERQITRHSFNFYRDQVEALRRLGAEAMAQGRETNLSAFVRQAVDDYLDRQQQR